MSVNAMNVQALQEAIDVGAFSGSYLPAVYVVEPTNRCNVSCIMCPNSRFREQDLGIMDLGLFEKIVTNIAPTAELVMLYFLGEPTLHPEFTQMLELARRAIKGRIVISTNALDLSESVIQALVTNTDIVITCIDRWDRAAYERIRRHSNFERVVQSVERLLKAREDSPSPVVIVKALDVNFRQDSAQQIAKEEEAFREYWLSRGGVPLTGWLNTWAGQLVQLERLSRTATPYADKQRSPCADLWFKMVINWRGEVVLCCHDWASSNLLGNVVEASIPAIWHSETLQRLRREHWAGQFTNSLCATCREWAEPDELNAYLALSPADLHRVF